MKIAVDLDEVLAQNLSAVIKFHNHTYGTSLKIDQFHSYHFSDIWGGTTKEAIQKIYEFHKTPYFKNIEPVEGSQEAMKALKKDNEIYLITSRQDDIIEETKEWVERYFPDIFSEIYFTNHYSQNGPSRTKKDVCDQLGIDVLVEDSPTFAIECLKPGRKIFLLDYPWNRDAVLPKGIQRVHSWEDILNDIKKP